MHPIIAITTWAAVPRAVCTRDEHEYETWEKRVDALVVLLTYKCGKLTVDELRRYIEELGPARTTASATTSAGCTRSCRR